MKRTLGLIVLLVAATANSQVLSISGGGTGAATASGALSNLGADAVGSAANKDVYVSTTGNDSNSGTSWGYAKLTLQAAINAASGSTGGVVHVGAGTYSLTSTVLMQPNVRVLCTDGATITQANGQNLHLIFDFSGNSANGAALQNCTIDGNRSNNTDNANNIAVYVASANDVQIDNNILKNLGGNGIEVTSGLRPKITRNRLTNFYTVGIAILTGAVQTPTYGLISDNQITSPFGAFAIGTVQADYTTIQRNNIVGSQSLGTNLSISGTAVTWVSGPTFTSSMAGQTIVYNGGSEANILTVNSSTSMTLSAAGTPVTNVPAIIGSADLINVANSSFNNIADNIVTGGATSSIVLHNFTGSESAQKNIIARNIVGKSGEGCIYLETTSGGPQLFDNTIINNNISDCGAGGTTAGVAINAGVGLLDFAPASLLRTFVDGNYVAYDGATGAPMTYWMETPAIGVGQAFIGKNTGYNMANPGIYNGISSVTLNSAWGSGASVAGIVSWGDSFILTVTAGTGSASTPSVTVNTRATTATNPPVMNCKQTGGSGSLFLVYGEIPGTDSAPFVQAFVMNGTPSAGTTYQFLCRG